MFVSARNWGQMLRPCSDLSAGGFLHFMHVSFAQIPFNLSHQLYILSKNLYKRSGQDVAFQRGMVDTN